jgi:hypothetical protein
MYKHQYITRVNWVENKQTFIWNDVTNIYIKMYVLILWHIMSAPVKTFTDEIAVMVIVQTSSPLP